MTSDGAASSDRGAASSSDKSNDVTSLAECDECTDWLACQLNERCFTRADQSLDAFHWESMYRAQCEATDDLAKKYEAEREKKADATLLKRVEDAEAALATVNARLIEANAALTAPRSAIAERHPNADQAASLADEIDASEICKDLTYEDRGCVVDALRAFAGAPRPEAREAQPSAECPICGEDHPHQHSWPWTLAPGTREVSDG